MNRLTCPRAQLPKLIQDDLSEPDSSYVLEHLEYCVSCQTELEALSADESWWRRVRVGLSDCETDDECRLAALEVTHSSIDAFIVDEPAYIGHDLPHLGTPFHPELLGRLDEYEIEATIGQGGMGVVFRAFDRSLNRPVAIKVMASHLSTNKVARERFEREARAAAAVVHPSVVPIYRVSATQEDLPYLAMAFADGLNLQQHVLKHGPFSVKDVLRIGIQIASGLAEAHKQGVIHRDIKPANVLLEKDVSRILITDFGLARAADDVKMTQSGCLAGTPSYMSPEQVIGSEIDSRTDLFSLGCLLYFIATGREPFRADNAFAVINKITFDAPISAQCLCPEIPDALNRVIERLLEKNPKDRIESAKELEQLLTKLLAHLQEPKRHKLPVVGATTSERRQFRRRVAWSLLGVSLVVVVAMGWAGLLSLPLSGSTYEHERQREHLEHHENEGGVQ